MFSICWNGFLIPIKADSMWNHATTRRKKGEWISPSLDDTSILFDVFKN